MASIQDGYNLFQKMTTSIEAEDVCEQPAMAAGNVLSQDAITTLTTRSLQYAQADREQAPEMIRLVDHSIVHKSPSAAADKYVEGTGDATIFFLGEDHDSLATQIANERLISQLAKSHKVVLFLEGCSTIDFISERIKKCYLRRLNLAPDTQRVEFSGWDISKDDQYFDRCNRFEETLKSLEYDLSQARSEEERAPLKQAIAATHQNLLDLIRKHFPRRTTSMISALQQAKRLQQPNSVLVFIAGAAHCVVPKGNQMTPEYQLQSFYKELDDREHTAAILLPTGLMESTPWAETPPEVCLQPEADLQWV